MQSDRPRRLWPWLAVAAIALPTLYVLSHGPWWMILTHHKPPQVVCEFGQAFYSPIWRLYDADMISEDVFGTFMDYNGWWVSLEGDAPTIHPSL